MPNRTFEKRIGVPKIAGRVSSSGLYETLNDMRGKLSARINEVYRDVAVSVSDQDGNGVVEIGDLRFGSNGLVVSGTPTGALISPDGLMQRHGFESDYITHEPYSLNPTLSYSSATRKLTVTLPVGSPSFTYWYNGKPVTVTNSLVSDAHPNVTGGYFITMNGDTGRLLLGTTPWNIMTDIPVAYIYYDASAGKGIAFGEMHSIWRNLNDHSYTHATVGTQVLSGFAISGYTLNVDSDAAVTFSVATGRIADEDIRVDTAALPDNGPYVILERTGVTGSWTWTEANTLPIVKGTTYPFYNSSGASWGRTELASGEFVNYWVFAATALDSKYQVFLVMGQSVHASLSAAQAESIGSISWGNVPFQELAPLYKLTFRAFVGYVGTAKIRLQSVERLIGTRASIIIAGISTSTHNSLSGRSDADCHPATAITNTPAGGIAAVTVQAALNELDTEKAPLASPTFTGVPAAPTAAAGTNTTQIATTAFVTTAVAAGGKVLRAEQFTANGTWTAPAGVTECWATGCGGGGGGGRSGLTSSGGYGGGGGAHSVLKYKLTVVPTTAYAVTIGAGGAGGTGATHGGNGGATSFGALLSIPGGTGAVTGTSAAGGAGGASGGSGGTAGTSGEAYVATYETVAQGGVGGISFPGGYGSGGHGGATDGDGQAGKNGYLLIEWNE